MAIDIIMALATEDIKIGQAVVVDIDPHTRSTTVRLARADDTVRPTSIEHVPVIDDRPTLEELFPEDPLAGMTDAAARGPEPQDWSALKNGECPCCCEILYVLNDDYMKCSECEFVIGKNKMAQIVENIEEQEEENEERERMRQYIARRFSYFINWLKE